MTPPMTPPPNLPAGLSVFHIANTKEAADLMNQLLGKTMTKMYKSASGVLLMFDGMADYLQIRSGQVPIFGPSTPSPTVPGMMEMPVIGTKEAVAISFSGAGLDLDPTFWTLWDDENAKLLDQQMLTGYSFRYVPATDGTQKPCAMLEFSNGLLLGVTTISADVLTHSKPIKPN